MKILVTNAASPMQVTGGAELSSSQIAFDLAALGHDVVFASLGQSSKDETRGGVRFTQVSSKSPVLDQRPLRGLSKTMRRLRREWQSLFATFGLWNVGAVRALLDRERPDVLITNSLRGWSTSVWRIADQRRIPVAHIVREYGLICPRGFDHNGEPCQTTDIRCRLRVAGSRRTGRRVAAWGVSESVLAEHLRRGVFAGNPTRAFYPTIGGQFIRPVDTDRDLGLGFLGRAATQKGLDVLGAAAERAGVTINVGAPDTPLLREYGARFPNALVLRGEVVPEQFLARLTALIVPSVWQEPLGRIVLEAAAVGTPVVISDAPGLLEAANVAGATWVSFKRGDSAELAHVLQRIANGTVKWQSSHADFKAGDVRELLASAEAAMRPRRKSVRSSDSNGLKRG